MPSRLRFDRLDIDCDLHDVLSAAKNQPTKRTNVAIIPAPRECYMTSRRDDIVCGIDVYPAYPRTINRYPGMRRICAYQSRPSWGRICSEISTHVTGREVDRAEASDLQVCEILANAP